MCKIPRTRSGSPERNKELIEGRRGLGAQGWDLGLGLGRKCAWQGWKERSPFRGGGGSGAGAALEQKPGRELSGAKRRRGLDFMAPTSASNRTSTFHTRGQIRNLEVASAIPTSRNCGKCHVNWFGLFGWNSPISPSATDEKKEIQRHTETAVFLIRALLQHVPLQSERAGRERILGNYMVHSDSLWKKKGGIRQQEQRPHWGTTRTDAVSHANTHSDSFGFIDCRT